MAKDKKRLTDVKVEELTTLVDGDFATLERLVSEAKEAREKAAETRKNELAKKIGLQIIEYYNGDLEDGDLLDMVRTSNSGEKYLLLDSTKIRMAENERLEKQRKLAEAKAKRKATIEAKKVAEEREKRETEALLPQQASNNVGGFGA